MHPNYRNIHNRFKINGFHLNRETLIDLAYNFIKEGADFEKEFGEFLLNWLDDNETVALMTSGTTGSPKLIYLQKQAMVNSAIATADFFNLRPGDKILHSLPTRYIAGKMMLVRAIIIGLEMDIIAPTSHLEGLLPSKKYDFGALVPVQTQAGINKLNQFKKIIIGGAKLSETLVNQLTNCTAEIYETYGMTETITHIAAKKIGADYFEILPNVTISKDERGCLVIQAPNIVAENIVTNDLVEIFNSKKFKWLGRFDNVINSGGIKYFPEQIEAKLNSRITQRFFIAGLPDVLLGQKIVLFIEGNEFSVPDTCYSTLAKFEKPKEIYFIPHFIESNNKLKRFEMVQNQINLL